jgi:hypothetical protein
MEEIIYNIYLQYFLHQPPTLPFAQIVNPARAHPTSQPKIQLYDRQNLVKKKEKTNSCQQDKDL